jgi:hypothetical protein
VLSYTAKGAEVQVHRGSFCKQVENLQKEVSYFDVTNRTRLAEVWREYPKKGQELPRASPGPGKDSARARDEVDRTM